jgi:two-component system NtrC family sensor kinase
VGVLDPDSDRIGVAHAFGGVPEQFRSLLEQALASEVTHVTDASGCRWVAARIAAKRGTAGIVLLSGGSAEGSAEARALLEALAAVAGVALEISQLVEHLEEGRRAWEETVDAISLALCMVDSNGRIQRANRAFATLIGVPIPSTVGRPWLEMIPPGWAEGVRTALSAPEPGLEVELQAGERSFLVTGFPIRGADRRTVVLLFEDQTERGRLQAQLIQSEKMSAIGQLIAGVAHDLNNPLASVVGFADFLNESVDPPPRLKEPLRVIQQEAERAAGIVKSLLSFARRQDRQRRPTALRPLLTTTLNLLRNQLMSNRVDARLEVDADLPELDVDPNQIQQVFVNLINNASQAIASAGRPGSVTVRARRWLDGIAVDVIDDGPGMSPATADKAFDPFFSTKPEGQGTGLGLSISQGIVKEHGGRITLSTVEGGGATFTVELPRQSRRTPMPAPSPFVEPSRPLKVLVVDDEPHILHYMRATLEAWGHQVEVAADGFSGLEQAVSENFDLIITDLRMPRLGGREFYEELGRRAPAMAGRIVFSTGDTVRGDTLEFLERQGRPCLHKPFALAELRTLLGKVARDLTPIEPAREE